MINLFQFKNKKISQEKEAYQILGKFYNSFFSDMYNELNISKYKQIRDAIGLVMRKFDSHDNPLAYTGKLVMYIQARVVLHHLPLTKEQQGYMQKLSTLSKNINLSFVYTSPIDGGRQFSLN